MEVFMEVEKSKLCWTTTLLLCLFTGCVGGHRFYSGHKGRAILYIFTLGGIIGILPLIDLISILTGKFLDAEGKLISK